MLPFVVAAAVAVVAAIFGLVLGALLAAGGREDAYRAGFAAGARGAQTPPSADLRVASLHGAGSTSEKRDAA